MKTLFLLLVFLYSSYSFSNIRFQGEIQDCLETLEDSKKSTTKRTQLSQYFCKGNLIAVPESEWSCEPFHPRTMLCKKAYFRCRRFYQCKKETAELNRSNLYTASP